MEIKLEFIANYGLFLAKTVTAIIAIGLLLSLIANAKQKMRDSSDRGHIEIIKLNQQYEEVSEAMMLAVLDESEQKAMLKKLQKEKKQQAKVNKQAKASEQAPTKDSNNEIAEAEDSAEAKAELEQKSRVFVIKFDGNISASAVTNLREEISAVLSQATSDDEVVVKLESAGGMVHSYGLASSQLDRLRKKNIPLTVCVDKVAASGGYMMACVADKILAAPFAIVGSIGVVAQMPNFNKLLKKHDVDYEILTAGEHKRTLTLFGENTDKGRKKFIEDLEETHSLFKDYVAERRPQVAMDKVATGEVWYGSRAKELALVDDVKTSDEYLMHRVSEADVFEIAYKQKRKLHQRLGVAAEESVDRLLIKWWDRFTNNSDKYL
jgi:serine protease SohB